MTEHLDESSPGYDFAAAERDIATVVDHGALDAAAAYDPYRNHTPDEARFRAILKGGALTVQTAAEAGATSAAWQRITAPEA